MNDLKLLKHITATAEYKRRAVALSKKDKNAKIILALIMDDPHPLNLEGEHIIQAPLEEIIVDLEPPQQTTEDGVPIIGEQKGTRRQASIHAYPFEPDPKAWLYFHAGEIDKHKINLYEGFYLPYLLNKVDMVLKTCYDIRSPDAKTRVPFIKIDQPTINKMYYAATAALPREEIILFLELSYEQAKTVLHTMRWGVPDTPKCLWPAKAR